MVVGNGTQLNFIEIHIFHFFHFYILYLNFIERFVFIFGNEIEFDRIIFAEDLWYLEMGTDLILPIIFFVEYEVLMT